MGVPYILFSGKGIRKGGSWQHAGGMLQPPWTRAAARANPLRRTKKAAAHLGGCFLVLRRNAAQNIRFAQYF
jgi:hypothetical protein